MQEKNTTQDMEKRLAELEILEKKENAKLEILRKKLELLHVLENKEKIKLDTLLQKKAEQEKKNTSEKEIKKPSTKSKIIKRIATAALITLLLGGGQKIVKSDGEDTHRKEEKKEIILPEQEISKTKNVTLGIAGNKEHTREKKPNITSSKTVIMGNTGEDEVFTIIETIQPDPNDDNRNMNDRYTDWKSLSKADQNTVKSVYKNVTTTDDKKTINTIINGLDKKILLGLYDICVKKSFILKKQGHDAQLKKMMVITQLLVDKQDQLIKNTKTVQTVEKIKEVQNMISTYTIEPQGFTIEKAIGDKVFEYNGDESKPLIERVTAINFTVKNNGKEIGTIGFDLKGKVITQYLSKNNQTYTVSQNRTTIKLTEGYLVSN